MDIDNLICGVTRMKMVGMCYYILQILQISDQFTSLH